MLPAPKPAPAQVPLCRCRRSWPLGTALNVPRPLLGVCRHSTSSSKACLSALILLIWARWCAGRPTTFPPLCLALPRSLPAAIPVLVLRRARPLFKVERTRKVAMAALFCVTTPTGGAGGPVHAAPLAPALSLARQAGSARTGCALQLPGSTAAPWVDCSPLGRLQLRGAVKQAWRGCANDSVAKADAAPALRRGMALCMAVKVGGT